MTQREGQYGVMTQKVLTFLWTHPGEFFTVTGICEQAGCTTTQARMALETLVRDGVVDREQVEGGRDEYVYRQH